MKALLFDLDGTLVDSTYQHVAAWTKALPAEGATRTTLVPAGGSRSVDVVLTIENHARLGISPVGSAGRRKGVEYRCAARVDRKDDPATDIEAGIAPLIASEHRRPIEIAGVVARQPRDRLAAARTLLKCNENVRAPLPGLTHGRRRRERRGRSHWRFMAGTGRK